MFDYVQPVTYVRLCFFLTFMCFLYLITAGYFKGKTFRGQRLSHFSHNYMPLEIHENAKFFNTKIKIFFKRESIVISKRELLGKFKSF